MKILNQIAKLTITILSLIIFPTNQIFGINYEAGDSLNVYAKNGLNIRSKASLDGEKVRLIPFGNKVTIIDTKNFELRDTFERVPGNWVEISYLGINGFVFDGYLSKLTIPKLSQKPQYLISNLTSYIKGNYKKKFEVSTHEPCNDPDGKECNHGQFITTYGKNIVHAVTYSWESETNDFHFRHTRFSEVINLLLLFVDEQNPLFQTLNKRNNTGFDHRREIKHQKEGINFILIWDKKDCLIKLGSWV